MKQIEFKRPLKNLSAVSRANSLLVALNGFRILTREPNMLLHLLAAIAVISAGLIVHLSAPKWIALAFAIVIVLIAEALNTALEQLCDYACNNKWSSQIKSVKDIAAAAVLLAAAAAVATGIIVFFFWN